MQRSRAHFLGPGSSTLLQMCTMEYVGPNIGISMSNNHPVRFLVHVDLARRMRLVYVTLSRKTSIADHP